MRKRAIILFYIWYVMFLGSEWWMRWIKLPYLPFSLLSPVFNPRFVNVLVYYGLSLGVSRLGTDLYLTQFVFGLVEIPARTLVLLVLPFGRRLSQSGFLAVGGLACLLMLSIPAGRMVSEWPYWKLYAFTFKQLPLMSPSTDHPNILTGLAMVGKFGITASFAIIYVYTAEIFPTVVR